MPISATGTSTSGPAFLQSGQSDRNSGFTLVELLVVITLLAMFSALSLPLIINQGEGGERRVLRRLAGTVKQLYNEATLTRDEHLLTFDIEQNTISAYRLRTEEGRIEKEAFGNQASLEPLQLRQIDVVGQGSFRNGQVSVHIYPLGWMEQTRLALQNEKGVATFLDFSPLTGSTKIEHEQEIFQ